MATSPEQDQLAQDYRNRVAANISNLSKSLSKATDTYDVVRQIPGVNQETLTDFLNVIEDVKTFSKTAESETADAIASKRDMLELKMQLFVDKTQADVKNKKVEEERKKEEEKKKAVEDSTFNPTRFTGLLSDTAKKVAYWVGISILALWGGSLASNRAINESFPIRLYYFIFGTLLTAAPLISLGWLLSTSLYFLLIIALVFILFIYFQMKIKFHAILAPLVQLPTYWWIHTFMFLFTYKPAIQPLSVTYVPNPGLPIPESQVPA